ncbi:hypothetical protein [Raoultella ornithinolytica]|uniref:hypothetical protein n=1 Tax=Raoultella ornithinolytica TaxID=54291 RepID=UPI0039B5C348
MTQKVVEKKEPQLVLESPDMREFYAEVAAITGYNTPGGSFLHIAFVSPFVSNYSNEKGLPAASKVVMRKVGAVTMTAARAKALHDALGKALEQHADSLKGE